MVGATSRHARTRPTETVLPGDVTSPRVARRFADYVTRAAAVEVAHDDLLLVVSELVTNAVRHVGGPVTLGVWVRDDGRVRVEVTDGDGAERLAAAHVADGESGRGLPIVAAVSRSWGVLDTPVGKTVWAEL